MIDEVLDYLKNYFVEKMEFGKFEIQNGTMELDAQDGQYIAIRGSVFNDGVYPYPLEGLTDEVYDGAVWFLSLPKDLLKLIKDIEEWQEKQGANPATGPYQSESFGGYSYTLKNTGSIYDGAWQSVFASHLNRWKKVRL